MQENIDENLRLLILACNGDISAKNQIVENNLGLIWKIVKKFGNRGHELDDLFQIGAIGLIRAIEKFDLNYDVKFSTYAVPMIIGEIKRFIRDDGIIKVSRSIKDISNKAKYIKEKLYKEFGREPTIGEIADRLEIAPEELAVALDAPIMANSLSETVHDSDNKSIQLIDRLKTDENQEKELVDKLVLGQLLSNLQPIERKVIILRYFKEKTQTQIAKMIGISQVQVSRLEKKVLREIKKSMDIKAI